MTSLPERLVKICEWDENAIRNNRLYPQPERPLDDHCEHFAFKDGARYQHTRMQPILKAMVECVEALSEIYEADLLGRGISAKTCNALSALEAAILKMEGE